MNIYDNVKDKGISKNIITLMIISFIAFLIIAFIVMSGEFKFTGWKNNVGELLGTTLLFGSVSMIIGFFAVIEGVKKAKNTDEYQEAIRDKNAAVQAAIKDKNIADKLIRYQKDNNVIINQVDLFGIKIVTKNNNVKPEKINFKEIDTVNAVMITRIIFLVLGLILGLIGGLVSYTFIFDVKFLLENVTLIATLSLVSIFAIFTSYLSGERLE
jgi:membrane protein YdbS with pleckstrin-like domain